MIVLIGLQPIVVNPAGLSVGLAVCRHRLGGRMELRGKQLHLPLHLPVWFAIIILL